MVRSIELPLRAERATLTDLFKVVKADLGEGAMLELDQELVLSLECPLCHTITPVLRPLAQVSFEEGHCPECGTLRETSLTHEITGSEDFLTPYPGKPGHPAPADPARP